MDRDVCQAVMNLFDRESTALTQKRPRMHAYSAYITEPAKASKAKCHSVKLPLNFTRWVYYVTTKKVLCRKQNQEAQFVFWSRNRSHSLLSLTILHYIYIYFTQCSAALSRKKRMLHLGLRNFVGFPNFQIQKTRKKVFKKSDETHV